MVSFLILNLHNPAYEPGHPPFRDLSLAGIRISWGGAGIHDGRNSGFPWRGYDPNRGRRFQSRRGDREYRAGPALRQQLGGGAKSARGHGVLSERVAGNGLWTA